MTKDIKQEAPELFREVFGKNMEDEAFLYKHFDNPDRLETIWNGIYKDDRLVSMQWYDAMRMKCMGADVIGVNAADTASASDARGLSYIKVYREGNKLMREQGVSLRFGMPNENSFPVITKMDDVFIGQLCNASLKKSDASKKEGRLIKRSLLDRFEKDTKMIRKTLSFERFDSCPFSKDDYATINARECKIFTMKSDSYFEWRVDGFNRRFGARNFSYCVIRDSQTGDLKAYAVLQLGKSDATVVDWVVLGDSIEKRQLLVEMLAIEILKFAGKVNFVHANPASDEGEIFRDLGFNIRTDGNFCVVAYDDAAKPCLELKNWEMRRLDFNWHLNIYKKNS